MADGPLIVQSDRTVLLEVAHPDAESARHELAIFAELERAPEHIHTYRITRLGLWNARAAGHTAEDMLGTLDRWTRFPVPPSVAIDIRETVGRYGRLVIERDTVDDSEEPVLVLRSTDAAVLAEVTKNKRIQPLLVGHPAPDTYVIDAWARGQIKQELLKIGWPAEDFAGYTPGTPHPIDLAEQDWHLRPYQRQAVDAFTDGGSGVVVLPCGAGKTLVGAGAMADTKTTTLILVTNTVSARQWRDELLKRTSLTPEEIGEYSGQAKEVKPVTIATYQILTAKRKGQYAHLALLDALDWGLIVYDEVHLLPAPVFKLTADLQARRRLGLTATLVREDGREGDVFSLIGPKRFDAPWKEIESQGFISPAACYEVRVDLPAGERLEYAAAADDERYRLAATAPAKIGVVKDLVARHAGEQTLVIGQYLDQIDEIAQALDAPQITGATPVDEREELYRGFREGKIPVLVVSKVANFSVDLPEASVAIQVSGSFGSRQEEAQRLGRLLRPKQSGNTASFYTLIARDTVDQDFAQNRQRFLAEQGYSYTILDADKLAA
ncbi:MAG: DNA repair helicase XPB [Microbacterium sp.]|jgi:DNA excision repair protein ERCC-3|uniref:DNA repair helicase XPB n=1 Tax=Microbacterium TaxID=33882 RepID=UPI000C3CC1C2|nr:MULTISPECIES: DNA repair helicase XPB [unclassified Microbacterium]MEC8762280.1 DNA repair helicase XPB [Actinomycetota bacterium]MBU20764.1 helicase [Microbacterium sp.]HAM13651.1 helicase [Microbacterium sp.]HBU42843.1 helicase [Microbacterium sp.]HCM51051.1 helicase [Microbacterium sp.]|tara:strand:- start:260 stop:1915 length:1656 start_codon:yes stop_codon:yes gene_type:complete